MPLVYYIDPGNGTAVQDEPGAGPDPNPSLSPPMVPVSFTAYLTELVGTLAVADPIAYDLAVKFSRSSSRNNAGLLDESVLDTGKTYAIFLPDVPDFAYSNVDFKLDGVLVQTETSAPWDYAGTAGGGQANVSTIPAGFHIIDAVVTYPGGTFTITSNFEVN